MEIEHKSYNQFSNLNSMGGCNLITLNLFIFWLASKVSSYIQDANNKDKTLVNKNVFKVSI